MSVFLCAGVSVRVLFDELVQLAQLTRTPIRLIGEIVTRYGAPPGQIATNSSPNVMQAVTGALLAGLPPAALGGIANLVEHIRRSGLCPGLVAGRSSSNAP